MYEQESSAYCPKAHVTWSRRKCRVQIPLAQNSLGSTTLGSETLGSESLGSKSLGPKFPWFNNPWLRIPWPKSPLVQILLAQNPLAQKSLGSNSVGTKVTWFKTASGHSPNQKRLEISSHIIDLARSSVYMIAQILYYTRSGKITSIKGDVGFEVPNGSRSRGVLTLWSFFQDIEDMLVVTYILQICCTLMRPQERALFPILVESRENCRSLARTVNYLYCSRCTLSPPCNSDTPCSAPSSYARWSVVLISSCLDSATGTSWKASVVAFGVGYPE